MSVTTSWADGRAKKTFNVYDDGFQGTGASGQAVTVPYGKLRNTTNYAYGSSAAGSAISYTETTYKALTQPSIFGVNNFLDLKDTESMTDSASGVTHTSVYGYDDATHGNLNSLKRHLDTANTDLETTFTYTSNGMLHTQKLPPDTITPDTTTTYDYSSTYQGAVPTTITDAATHPTTVTYDPASLRPLITEDPNKQITIYDYYGDGRLYHIYRPDKGITTYAYPSANEVDETVTQDNSTNVVTKTFYDGLGRKVRTLTQGGCSGGGDVSVETTYDLMDRVRSITSPHCGTGPVYTTYYGSSDLTQNDGYDALGRPILLTNPDGTTKTWAYNDRSIEPVNDSVKITDEAGHTTTQITDALGHLVGVVEANGAKTKYTMNAFGNLTDVSQPGLSGEPTRTRHFSYDSFGRLLTAQNPETAAISYTYDNHNNLMTKKDARGVVTGYQYDALNRLTSKSYSDGTRPQKYAYDGKDENAADLGYPWNVNAVGKLSRTTDLVGVASNYSYDAMGRLVQKADCLPDLCTYTDTQKAEYDLAGNMTSFQYPDGRKVKQSFDNAGRFTNVSYVGWNSISKNASYFDAPNGSYDPAGHLIGGVYGNGISLFAAYDNRQRIGTLAYGTPQQLLWGRNYYWTPNSNMASTTDLLSGNQRQFGYDALNRLTSAVDLLGSSATNQTASSSVGSGGSSQTQITIRFTNDSCSQCLNQAPYQDRNLHVQSVRVGVKEIAGSDTAWSYSTQNSGGDLKANGDMTATFSAVGSVTVTAYGDPDNGVNAHMQVLVNGTLAGEWDVTSISTAYSIVPSANANATPVTTPSQWTDPDDSNLLQDADTPGASSWGLFQTSVSGQAAAPDGSLTAYTATAQAGSSDSFLSAQALTNTLVDGETITGSVWLRSSQGSYNLNLYLVENGSAGSDIPASKTVLVTTAWQQFQLSGYFSNGHDQLRLQIGGGQTFVAGQTLQLWGAKLEDTGRSGKTVTNYAHYSQRLTGGDWAFAGAVASDNAATAPDGSNTAAAVTANAQSTTSRFSNNVTLPAMSTDSPLTGSVWLRSPNGMLTLPLSLLAAGGSTLSSKTITVTGDWTRFTVTATNAGTLSGVQLLIGSANSSGFGQGMILHVWGAQVELSSSPGPYVATGAAAASIGTNLTNLLPNSTNLIASSWGQNNFQIATNAVAAPDGSNTGAQLTAAANSTDSIISDDVANPALYDGAQVTGSVFLRVPSGTATVNLYFLAQNNDGVHAQQQTVTVNTQWQRFNITKLLPSGLKRLWFQVGGGGSITAGMMLHLWGPQVELASTAGPYVPTGTQPVLSGQELTNILPSSQAVSGPTWAKNFTGVTLNAGAAPDGSLTATTLTAQASDSFVAAFTPNPSLYDNQTVTASVYLRVPSGTLNLKLFLIQRNGDNMAFPTQTVTVTTSWQRFVLTVPQLLNGLEQLYLQIGGGNSFATGQVLQIWGAQLVTGSSPAPYTPTSETVTYTNSSGITSTGTALANGMNLQYGYDSFGNLTKYGSFTPTYSAKNQMNGWVYDASGNLLQSGTAALTWDAESRVSSAAGASYLYDAEGNRVQSNGAGVTDTVYFNGRPVARYANGQWTDLIYGPQGMIAEVAGAENAEPSYRLTDHLGTLVGTTDHTQALLNPMDYTPFGQVFSGNTSDPYFFTGKERDAESGLDYFGARYYANSMGRWMSPDWADKPEAVPYSQLDNPQSLNLYGYVNNNPLSKADKDGHCPDACVLEGGAVFVAAAVVGIAAILESPAGQRSLSTFTSAAGGFIASSFQKVTSVFSKAEASASAPTVTGVKAGEPPQLVAGKEAHKNEEVRPGEKAEVPTPSGKRMDRYNEEKAHIRELKPDNPRGEQMGKRQLERYKTEMEQATGRPHTTELTKYPPPTPKP